MASNSDGPALYASVGPELTHYDVDVEASTLTRRGTVGLPASVQYVWPHASRRPSSAPSSRAPAIARRLAPYNQSAADGTDMPRCFEERLHEHIVSRRDAARLGGCDVGACRGGRRGREVHADAEPD